MAFAACNKTEVVYPEGPQEISFTAVSKVATKAPVAGTTFSTDDNMRVSAYLSKAVGNETNVGNYFSDILFEGDNGTPDEYWVGGQYWPLFPSTVNFLAITEKGGGINNTTTTFGTPAASSATVTLANNNAFAQNDLMYAVGQGVTDGSGPYDAVSMKFNHALSWINFSFKSNIANKITVKSVKLTAAYDGELAVDFSEYASQIALTSDAVTATWTPDAVEEQFAPNSGYTAENGNVVLVAAATAYPYGGGLLVVPGTYTGRKFVISYQVDGKDFTYTYPVSQTWEQGKKYTYNVTMTLNEIKITPSITDWTTVTPATEVPLS